MVSAAGFWTIAGLVAQESRTQLVEPCAAYSKMVCGGVGVEVSSIEVTQNTTDEFGRQTMNQLFLFTPLTYLWLTDLRQHSRPYLVGSAPKPPEFCACGQWA
jgi:hypothetical protein